MEIVISEIISRFGVPGILCVALFFLLKRMIEKGDEKTQKHNEALAEQTKEHLREIEKKNEEISKLQDKATQGRNEMRNMQFKQVNARLEQHEEKFKHGNVRFSTMEKTLGEIQVNVSEIKAAVGFIKENLK